MELALKLLALRLAIADSSLCSLFPEEQQGSACSLRNCARRSPHAIAGVEHSAMRDWKKLADDRTSVMWMGVILFVVGLLAIASGVTPVVDPGGLVFPGPLSWAAPPTAFAHALFRAGR